MNPIKHLKQQSSRLWNNRSSSPIPKGFGLRTFTRFCVYPVLLTPVAGLFIGATNVERVAEQRVLQSLSQNGGLVRVIEPSIVDFSTINNELPPNIVSSPLRPHINRGIVSMNPEDFLQNENLKAGMVTPLEGEQKVLQNFDITINRQKVPLDNFCTQSKLILNDGGSLSMPVLSCFPKGVNATTGNPDILFFTVSGANATWMNGLPPAMDAIETALNQGSSIQVGIATLPDHGFTGCKGMITLNNGAQAAICDTPLNVHVQRTSYSEPYERIADYVKKFPPSTDLILHTFSAASIPSIEPIIDLASKQPDRRIELISNSTYTGLTASLSILQDVLGTYSRIVGLPASHLGIGNLFEPNNMILPIKLSYSPAADQTKGITPPDTNSVISGFRSNKSRLDTLSNGVLGVPQLAVVADLIISGQKPADSSTEFPVSFTRYYNWQTKELIAKQITLPKNLKLTMIHSPNDKVADDGSALTLCKSLTGCFFIKYEGTDHNPIYGPLVEYNQSMRDPTAEAISNLN